eukprot:gene9235-1321_t
MSFRPNPNKQQISFQQGKQMTQRLPVKVFFKSETRRFETTAPYSFQKILTEVFQVLINKSIIKKQFIVKYLDDDKDWVNCDTEKEFQEALKRTPQGLILQITFIEDEKLEENVKTSFKTEKDASIVSSPKVEKKNSFQQPKQSQNHQPVQQQQNVTFNQNSSTNFQPFLQNQNSSSQSFSQSRLSPSNSNSFQVVNNTHNGEYSQQPQSFSVNSSNNIQNPFVKQSPVIQTKSCSHCSVNLDINRYECINCPRPFYLCETCFSLRSEIHPSHLFQKKSK